MTRHAAQIEKIISVDRLRSADFDKESAVRSYESPIVKVISLCWVINK